MKFVVCLLCAHLLALAFGLGGILIALPHPELWAANPAAGRVFAFGMQHGGALHIVFGAATMLVFGFVAIGPRKTLIFFAAGTLLPLCAELLGTSTGWPFGGYTYTSGLGVKIAGHVPYSVPLSWFYMGFASYLLATVTTTMWQGRRRAWVTIVLAAWLLMAWDLVLDPAMASPGMPLHFWVWHENGPYFGMPLRNLAGWFGTGILFMTASRLLWRVDPEPRRIPVWLPFSLYVANTLWAAALALGVGLWPAAVAALALGVLPASLAWQRLDPATARAPSPLAIPDRPRLPRMGDTWTGR